MSEHTKIYDNKVPYDVRQAALRAIKKGTNLEAVAEANTIADEINRVSFYETQMGMHAVQPFKLV